MMDIVYTKDAPEPVGPYSQAVFVGSTLYCSGQIPIDPKSGQLKTASIAEETHQIFSNIQAVLKAADLNLSHVFKTTIFLTDMGTFGEVNEIYSSYFPNNPPARSCVEVAALPKGVHVEIEVIAHR